MGEHQQFFGVRRKQQKGQYFTQMVDLYAQFLAGNIFVYSWHGALAGPLRHGDLFGCILARR